MEGHEKKVRPRGFFSSSCHVITFELLVTDKKRVQVNTRSPSQSDAQAYKQLATALAPATQSQAMTTSSSAEEKHRYSLLETVSLLTAIAVHNCPTCVHEAHASLFVRSMHSNCCLQA